MAIDSNFSSLFQNLKLDDPWLPPKPWESISSESGLPSPLNPPSKPLYDPSTISEISLVRLVINALQGVESSLYSIEKLSESFCSELADRTSHRVPNLWYRTSSTNALGKILKSIGRTGLVVFLLRKFVDYFLRSETGECRVYSIVNQAFAVAVRKILEGFICSLDTLYASVKLRRSPDNVDTSGHRVGCLTSVVHSEITVLEVYLHTKGLRTQIEAVGNICCLKNVNFAFSTLCLEDLTAEATIGFGDFPRSANLLSYLYAQLRDADPVHRTLIEFLFICSCEPYCGFIKSWIYQARVNDPYKEFIVEYVGDSQSYSAGGAGFSNGIWLSSVRVRAGVSIPCFMESFCLPLLRAGQQLQVLIKLLELCHCVYLGDQTYKDILPYWIDSSSEYLPTGLTFDKRSLEEMVLTRENMYQTMQEKLQNLFTRFDIKYQPMSCAVKHFGTLSDNGAAHSLPFTVDESVVTSLKEDGDINSEAGTCKSDNSSATCDICYEVDAFESSECSLSNSSGEENESDKPTTKHDSLTEKLRNLSASALFTDLTNKIVSPNSFESEKLHAVDCAPSRTILSANLPRHLECPSKESKLTDASENFLSEGATCSRSSEIGYADYQSVDCWPLGGLSKNPFYDDKRCGGETQLRPTDSDCSINWCDRSNKFSKGDIPYSEEIYMSKDSILQQAREDIQFPKGTYASSKSFITRSWNLKYNCKVFNMNPMLTKNSWCHMRDKSSGRNYVGYKQPSVLYFDFSSVEDPVKIYGERLLASPHDEFQDEHCLFLDSSGPTTRGVDDHCEEQSHQGNNTPVDQSSSASVVENLQNELPSASASGGAEWERSLCYLSKSMKRCSGGHRQSSGTTFNMPLDVIIDKCILQEISLQYKYISNFTIKLLEDGFDLREHFLALRRYHFIEFADWADLFIVSFWHHKWPVADASQKISEIQGFLDLALQRSSCKGDPYKERLFVYMKVHGTMPLSMASIGVHAFDFVALGYRVDWPISIIITPNALKIYADIFSFLIQVKLAVFSLTDIWRSLKDLVHLLGQNHISKLEERDRTCFNTIMRMRHQVLHFVSTLQQYVQSQLSHVSWCRLLHSLKHQVNDMLDLETVHMAYLADSLHICFLSDETRSIAGIIENILQCALDFRSCFTGCCWENELDPKDSSNFLARLNFPQVLAIKATFERNLKELYLRYLKSPKHGELSICYFWEYLNYNDYYSSVINDGVAHYVF